MTKSVFSLQRLTECKKTMRAAAVVAMWSVTTPVYSGGLTNFVKGVVERTTVYLYAENGNDSLSSVQKTKRGVAAIVYSPSTYKSGRTTDSALRVAQVSNVLDGQFYVADLTPTGDYTLNAAKKQAKKYWGLSSGAWVAVVMLTLGVGYAIANTQDDGNRNHF